MALLAATYMHLILILKVRCRKGYIHQIPGLTVNFSLSPSSLDGLKVAFFPLYPSLLMFVSVFHMKNPLVCFSFEHGTPIGLMYNVVR